MTKADFLGSLLGDEKPERVLRGLPLVQVQLPELFLLDAGEGVVDDGQHEIHEKVEVHPQVRDEEDRGPPVVVVGLHHHVGVALKRKAEKQ